MTQDINQKVKKIVADHLGVDEAKVTDESSFIDDLGADSLDTVELVMAFEEEFGSEHPTTAAFVFNLAKLYQKQSQYKNAEPLYKRALAIRENSLGNGHADVAASYNSLGQLYDAQGQLADAEHFYSRALDVMTVVLADNPHVINAMSRTATTYRAQAYHNRARLLHEQGSYADAENLFGAAMVMMRSTFGEKHAEVARGYENYAALLRDMGRPEEAAEKEEYARAIRAHVGR